METVNKAYAPYNFIPLAAKVFQRYESNKELPRHDIFVEGTLEGYIDYDIECVTPTIVSASTGISGKSRDTVQQIHFTKEVKGRYCIPGSTLKGLIRTNAMVLGCGITGDYIEEQTFLYRAMADNNKRLREDYNTRLGFKSKLDEKGNSYSIVENVQAGYIYKVRDEEYYIIPAKQIKGKSYLRVSEKVIAEKKMYIRGMSLLSKGRSEYRPYCTPVKYDVNEEQVLVKWIESQNSNKQCKYKGYMLGSGYMSSRGKNGEDKPKNTHYIINEVDFSAEEIPIRKEDIRAYRGDLEKNKNVKKDSFYLLPKEKGKENMKPIFYVQHHGKLYFGYTPYLRLFYDHSIYEGIAEVQKDAHLMDYTRSMFGFANLGDEKNKISYKGRIQIEPAIVTKAIESKPYTVVLGEPKATCLPHYLQQSSFDKEGLFSYNDSDFSIRGMKVYWLKDKVQAEATATGKPSQDREIYPLDKGSVFKGRIHFNNLYPDELGLLLWSLSLDFNKKSYQNIGLAKPYGFGQVIMKDIQLYTYDVSQKYSSFTVNYERLEDYQKYIQCYKHYVKEHFQTDIDTVKAVREYEIIKTERVSGEQAEFRYMGLKQFSQRQVLPTISAIKQDNFKYATVLSQQNPKYNNSNTYNKKPYNRNAGNAKGSRSSSQSGDWKPDSPSAKLKDIMQ